MAVLFATSSSDEPLTGSNGVLVQLGIVLILGLVMGDLNQAESDSVFSGVPSILLLLLPMIIFTGWSRQTTGVGEKKTNIRSNSISNTTPPSLDLNTINKPRTEDTKKLNLVVVGVGLIGPRHAEHVKKNEMTCLFAIIDLNPASKSVADKLNTDFFPTIEDMIQYCQKKQIKYPDGAIICTPNHTHVKVASKLANYGINILIEKPVSPTAEDSKALKIFANFKKVKTLVGHHRRFNPFIIAAKQQISKLGKVVAIQGTWALKKDEKYFQNSPWRTNSKTGGGALLINLIHDLDLLQYLFGPISQVYAESLLQQREYKDVDEGAVLTLRFKSGVCGTFICSDNVPSPFNFESSTGENPTIPYDSNVQGLYRVFGSQGTLSIPDFNLYTHTEKSGNWSHKVNCDQTILREDLRKQKPFDCQLTHFANMINRNHLPNCTIDDGISALLVIESVQKSIHSGLPQVVPDITSIKPNFNSLDLDLNGLDWDL